MQEGKEKYSMEKRTLGKTGEEISLFGIGGFHLLEIGQSAIDQILNLYLDVGGNYIESSSLYGKGASEQKISRSVGHRRQEFLLATKVGERDSKGASRTLERSLENLRTDHVDIWFMHAVQTKEDADQLLAPEGALEAAEKAKKEGKVRFIGISGHGQPVGLLPAMEEYTFDALMTVTNFYDHLNYPDVDNILIPLAQRKGTAIIGMKAIGDGYLWRSVEIAMRYAWSLPVSTVVVGINTLEFLKQHLVFAEIFRPMSAKEIDHLYQTAPEFREYVCRQCKDCNVSDTLPLKRIFELEGWYDRQMWDGKVINSEDYSIRMRLGPWFGQQELARTSYKLEGIQVNPEKDYTHLNDRCPYIVNILSKLRIAQAKLTSNWSLR